jgi:signal transduction histidine kinase
MQRMPRRCRSRSRAGATETRVLQVDPAWTELPTGAWHRAPRHMALIPIAASGESGRAGMLAVGLNPFRKFDGDYRGFLDLVAGQISAGIANAQAYEQERRRAESLAELDRAKTAFFSNVSHEFRTPLTLMLGRSTRSCRNRPSRWRLRIGHSSRSRSATASGLSSSSTRCSTFAASRPAARRRRTSPPILAAFTAELASNFRSACERAGLELEVDCPPLAEAAYVDREMWEKIVLNLVSNAFKFTLEGNIRVSLRLASGSICSRNKGYGRRHSAEELPRMFERFHRVEGVRGRSHEGSGIGLALVQELVKLHGGSIGVESELGQAAPRSR